MMAGFDLSTAKPATGFDLSTARPAGEGMPGPRRSLSDVGSEALANFPQSAGKFVSGVVESVLNPIDTLTSISDLAAGGLEHGAAGCDAAVHAALVVVGAAATIARLGRQGPSGSRQRSEANCWDRRNTTAKANRPSRHERRGRTARPAARQQRR